MLTGNGSYARLEFQHDLKKSTGILCLTVLVRSLVLDSCATLLTYCLLDATAFTISHMLSLVCVPKLLVSAAIVSILSSMILTVSFCNLSIVSILCCNRST